MRTITGLFVAAILFIAPIACPLIDCALATSLQSNAPADHELIQTNETTWSRHLHSKSTLPKWIDLGIEQRTRVESFDHPFRPGEFNTDTQMPLRSRVRFGLNGPSSRILFEGQDSRSLGVTQGEFTNTRVKNTTDVLQLFGSFTLRNVLGTSLRTDIHIGRMTMDFGHRRYVARNNFRNTTNSFNGIHWQVTRETDWRIRAFFTLPTIRHEQRADTFDQNFSFWGTYYETEQIPWIRSNLYYFGLNDQRSTNINHRQLHTFGGRVYTPPKIGKIDYEIEVAGQGGKKGTKDHSAYNPHMEIGYTFNLPWSPRLLAQYDYASGTHSPNGNQSHTFDKLFGARRFELAPTGIFGPFDRSNISSPGWRVMAQPSRGWNLHLKHRIWHLAQARDQFAGSGLQDETGRSGKFLGQDIELRAQWKVNANMEFDLGYDHWFKGSFFARLPTSAALPAGGEKDTNYFYLLTKVRF